MKHDDYWPWHCHVIQHAIQCSSHLRSLPSRRERNRYWTECSVVLIYNTLFPFTCTVSFVNVINDGCKSLKTQFERQFCVQFQERILAMFADVNLIKSSVLLSMSLKKERLISLYNWHVLPVSKRSIWEYKTGSCQFISNKCIRTSFKLFKLQYTLFKNEDLWPE